MKKRFNKKLVMANVDDENFVKSAKCWACENAYVGGNDEVIGVSLINEH